MDIIQLMPRLYFTRLPVGHAYLWHDPGGLTLIDTGLPGSAPLIAQAIGQAGYQPADLRRLVFTHFHADHIGAAADIAGWGEVEVLAHHADAPFIHARATGPPPDLAGWEQPLYDRVMSRLPPQPPVPPRIDRELGYGDDSASATAPSPWPSPATRQAASRCGFPGTGCCLPATPPRAAQTGRSPAACSTSAAPKPPRRSAGWRASAPNSPASATASRSPTEPQPHCEPPP
jgi:Metallo-beta-lactamase superfamily